MPLDTIINVIGVDEAAAEFGTAEKDLMRLERMINYVSARAERYCNTRFKKRFALSLTLSGATFELLDVGSPIIAVTSVTAGGVLLASTDYQVLKERGQLYRAAGWSDASSAQVQGINNVVVVGDFGYDPIPHEVVEAALMLLRIRGSRAGGEGIRAERIGDYSYERAGPMPGAPDTGAGDMPEEVRHLLDPYVRHVV